eukprot:TRINITY_DN2701_c0_g1_i1.p1 TRINITY_DN2701_c0_g1~~TRINITY_DN2701_c0_g1_i1.p1  ORF type:complete len:312 (-),score=40.68 TRINITY_DN2701_c0_g1_i1:18-953(-)
MEDTTAMQLKIDDLQNQIKILSLSTPLANSSFAHSDRVKLNVGGHFFETTTQTLRKYPNSMLDAMFSGRFVVETDKDGVYFIDRDGPSFRCILNFLRDGIVPRHLAKSDLEYLVNEAEYFGITELIKAINTAPINGPSSDTITVHKIEQIPDHIYEFGVPKQDNRIFHFDTMRGYSLDINKPMKLESAQILVSSEKPFAAEAYLLLEGDAGEPVVLQTGTKTSNITSEEPMWITSHFTPVELSPGTRYAIIWSFSPKSGYVYITENGSNPQPGRDVGPFTVYGRNVPDKWSIESNYYNIRMRVSAKSIDDK